MRTPSIEQTFGYDPDKARQLLRESLRSLAVAGVLCAVAFALGARDPKALVILFVALTAADMNLRAVIRKAANGKFGGAGGYLAHVGVGIMMAGIVISGVYAKTTRLTLPTNQPVKVGDATLTFLRVVPATATETFANNGAQPARCGDSLQTRDTGADD